MPSVMPEPVVVAELRAITLQRVPNGWCVYHKDEGMGCYHPIAVFLLKSELLAWIDREWVPEKGNEEGKAKVRKVMRESRYSAFW